MPWQSFNWHHDHIKSVIIASVVKPQPRGQLESNCCKAWANLSLVGAHSRREAHATIVQSTESTLLLESMFLYIYNGS